MSHSKVCALFIKEPIFLFKIIYISLNKNCVHLRYTAGLPLWLSSKESTCQCWRHGFDPWVGKIHWRRAWQPTPVFLPGESHGQRSLQSMGLQRVRHNLATKQQQRCAAWFIYTYEWWNDYMLKLINMSSHIVFFCVYYVHLKSVF